jgi:RHS repeat-associated protein
MLTVLAGRETIKFTGKERDAESGLDFFGARYMSSAQGRFSSPDEPLSDQNPANPQSWNLYSYVRNNPLINVDPSGQDCITTSNQTDKSVSVTVTSGNCNGDVGAYVPGTVDASSLSYNGTSVGYSYTPYDSNSLAGNGTVNLGPGQSSGDINPFGLAVVQAVGRNANGMYGIMGTFAGGSLLGGAAVAGGLAVSGAGLTTSGLQTAAAAAPLLPAVPSALEKLQKIGLTLEQANAIIQSPATQKLIDNANNGNINCVQQVGDKVIRITTDPTGQRIISAGYMRANSIVNGLATADSPRNRRASWSFPQTRKCSKLRPWLVSFLSRFCPGNMNQFSWETTRRSGMFRWRHPKSC